MPALRLLLLLIGVLHLGIEVLADSDLRSALDAIDRRQKELAEYEEAEQYGFNPYDQPDELSFLSNAADSHSYEKDYLDDDSYEPYSKRFTSSFRERLEEARERQLEELARSLYNNLENSGLDRNRVTDLWERYYGNGLNYVNTNALNKRYYKNSGLRKRGRYIDNNEEPIYSVHHHVPRADESEYPMNSMNRHQRKSGYHPTHGYNKYYMISKRSSPYVKEQKRSVKKQTDPKVEKDLSIIFGNVPGDLETNHLSDGVSSTLKPPESTKKPEETPPPRKIEKKDKPKMDANKETDIHKEVFEPVAPQKSKELKLKKKSIDWSDYFGLDRRKKSENNNGLDKEWLMERYHKAIAVTAKKRNADFRNRETTPLKKDDPHEKEERKITEMDQKLEKLEDEIVEDALKYTGARQDEEDSKEIQQIKDNIISRLAQAYNIEKMRNALEEYKKEIEKARREVEKGKGEEKLFPEYTLEEKRLSVPRKEAVDDSEEVDGDNNIKCTNSDDCHEQNYKLPSDILDTHFSNVNYECPVLQRACNDVASVVGYYGHVFEAACHIHQMCLLCSNNSWFSPTRQCNALFLTKAYELCLGKEECKKEARHSVKYLLDINKSLQAQTALSDQCELQCPEILSK